MSTEKLFVVAVLILLLRMVGGLIDNDYLRYQIKLAELECRK